MASELKKATLEIKFDGTNWTDVTADVRANTPITGAYGIFGHGPLDRMASAGTMSFALDDSEKNSASLLGYYSPEHANARTGFELNVQVRLTLVFGTYYDVELYDTFTYGADWVKFVGKVTEIRPEAGVKGPRVTQCQAQDFVYEMSQHLMDRMALSTSILSNTLFSNIVANMPTAPVATSYSTGQETFAYGGDDLKDERSTALAAAQKVAVSEFGFAYLKGDDYTGGILTFEDRHDRVNTTAALDVSAHPPLRVKVTRSLDNIYNRVRAVAYPRVAGASPEILYSLQTNLLVAANTTEIITARYRDPTNLDVRLSGQSMVTPVVSTDYKFGSTDGEGVEDKNADLTVTVSFGANAAQATLQNTSGTAGYVNLLQLRGTALRVYDPVTVVSEDATSKTAYGLRDLSLVLPWQDNPLSAKDFGDTTLAFYKNPRQMVDEYTISSKNVTLGNAAVRGEPGTRVTLAETVTDISGDYFIQGVRFIVYPPDNLQVSWLCRVAAAEQAWLLGEVGFSELGTTTILGVA